MSSLSSLQGASGKLLRRIHRACRPSLDEPNIALNLEICDLINSKQGNLPREACVATVKLINSRDPQVSELAIKLLDYLVKNCGYPIHLQISRKEFLNELVKKFPERPPPAYTRTQRLILGTIAEWVHTICRTSRYKEDLGYVKDMYRLLRSKGYDFPAVKKEDAAVLNPSDNLKSISELQKEEQLAQSAKLQELVRRGRPQDLKEANDLMKIMSGFKENESLEESKLQINEDLEKLKRKSEILDEMLNNLTNSGMPIDKSDETLNELISSLKVSQPKIQKLIEEESHDQDEVTRLLSLNDGINSILQKVSLLSEGDIANASKIKTGAGSNSLNLIDFDDDNESTPAPTAQTGAAPSTKDAMTDLLSDLGGLSFGGNSSSTSNGAINLFSSPSPQPTAGSTAALDLFGIPSTTASTSQAQAPVTTTTTTTPKQLDPFSFDFLSGSSNSAPAPQPAAVAHQPAPTGLSSIPAQSFSTELFKSSAVVIKYIKTSSNPLTLTFKISNITTSSNITNLKFSLAVTKQFELSLKSPSSNSIFALGGPDIEQIAVITYRNGGSVNDAVKVKFKLDYSLDGVSKAETGVATIAA